MHPAKFRYNAAITIAAIVAFFGAVPLATSRAYFLPILLVPILIGIWGWRAGTDASQAGLRIRALFGSRLIPWAHITQLVPVGRGRVYAVLSNGHQLRLPAVGPHDLPRITQASPAAPEPDKGQPYAVASAAPEPDNGQPDGVAPAQADPNPQ